MSGAARRGGGLDARGALAERAGVRLRRHTPAALLERITDGDELIGAFRDWAESPVVRDARQRRNLAIHAHYVKRPYRPELTWLLEQVTVGGAPSPYDGPLDVHSYAAAYAETLAALARIADALSQRP